MIFFSHGKVVLEKFFQRKEEKLTTDGAMPHGILNVLRGDHEVGYVAKDLDR